MAIIALIIISSLSFSTNSEWFSVCVWVIPSIIVVLILGADSRDKCIGCIFENKYIVKVGNYRFVIFLIHQLVIRYVNYIFDVNNVIKIFLDIIFIILSIKVWTIINQKLQFIKVEKMK